MRLDDTKPTILPFRSGIQDFLATSENPQNE